MASIMADHAKMENKMHQRRPSTVPSLASLSSCSESSLRLPDDSYHSCSAYSCSTTKEKKRVSFSEIEVVELPIILGDHPFCRDGLPVQPGWNHSDRYSVSVDTYEESRSPVRRKGRELYISSFDRLKLIRNIPLSPMSCPARIQGASRSKLWREDNILEKVAPPPMKALDEIDKKASDNGEKKDDITERERVEQRLYDANNRLDRLISRLDDLDLIRKERIQRRRKRRARGVVSC